MPAKLRKKLQDKHAGFTVAEVVTLTQAVADSLGKGPPLGQFVYLTIGKTLMDCIQGQMVGPDTRSKPTNRLFQFKITLKDTNPPIWRRIQVPDCTLDELHEHIQTAMGWTNSHLHQFKIGKYVYGDPELMQENFDDIRDPFVFPAFSRPLEGRKAVHARPVPERVVRLLVRPGGQRPVRRPAERPLRPAGDAAGSWRWGRLAGPGGSSWPGWTPSTRPGICTTSRTASGSSSAGTPGRRCCSSRGRPARARATRTAFAVFARLQAAMREGRPFRVFLSCKTHAATDVLLKNVLEVQEKLRELQAADPKLFAQAFRRPAAGRAAVPGGSQRPAACWRHSPGQGRREGGRRGLQRRRDPGSTSGRSWPSRRAAPTGCSRRSGPRASSATNSAISSCWTKPAR